MKSLDGLVAATSNKLIVDPFVSTLLNDFEVFCSGVVLRESSTLLDLRLGGADNVFFTGGTAAETRALPSSL